MGEDDAQLIGRNGIEMNRIAQAAGRLRRLHLGLRDVPPRRTVEELDDVLGRSLHTAAIVIEVKFDATDFLRRTEIDFEPIGRGR